MNCVTVQLCILQPNEPEINQLQKQLTQKHINCVPA